jgi:catechol 2,3-dioxygenase-like lactoylglutathione lyase family enzyme
MVRVTDPERSRAFYEALGMEFRPDLDIVREGQLEATNYFFAFPGELVGSGRLRSPRFGITSGSTDAFSSTTRPLEISCSRFFPREHEAAALGD